MPAQRPGVPVRPDQMRASPTELKQMRDKYPLNVLEQGLPPHILKLAHQTAMHMTSAGGRYAPDSPEFKMEYHNVLAEYATGRRTDPSLKGAGMNQAPNRGGLAQPPVGTIISTPGGRRFTVGEPMDMSLSTTEAYQAAIEHWRQTGGSDTPKRTVPPGSAFIGGDSGGGGGANVRQPGVLGAPGYRPGNVWDSNTRSWVKPSPSQQAIQQALDYSDAYRANQQRAAALGIPPGMAGYDPQNGEWISNPSPNYRNTIGPGVMPSSGGGSSLQLTQENLRTLSRQKPGWDGQSQVPLAEAWNRQLFNISQSTGFAPPPVGKPGANSNRPVYPSQQFAGSGQKQSVSTTAFVNNKWPSPQSVQPNHVSPIKPSITRPAAPVRPEMVKGTSTSSYWR